MYVDHTPRGFHHHFRRSMAVYRPNVASAPTANFPPFKLVTLPIPASRTTLTYSGYKSSPFPLKANQQAAVTSIIAETGFMPAELVAGEVDWFYNHLGIDNAYFLAETPDAIADHVLALYSAKLLAYTKHDPEKLVIDLEKITPEGDKSGNKEGAVWIHTSEPGVTVEKGPGASVEKQYVTIPHPKTRGKGGRE